LTTVSSSQTFLCKGIESWTNANTRERERKQAIEVWLGPGLPDGVLSNPKYKFG
jgi:hypothetical protein